MVDIRPISSSSASRGRQRKTTVVPDVRQVDDLMQREPNLGMNKNKDDLFFVL